MTGCTAGVVLGSSTLAQLAAGWTAVLPLAALAIYGWYRGAFLAAIAGLQVLAACLAAVGLAAPVSGFVESLGCPAAQSLAAAYALVFVIVIVGIRLAVGAGVPDGAARLTPIIDQAAAVMLGAVAGAALGGAILVGWSMADMPAWIKLDNTHQPLDSGGRVLWTFARFAAGSGVPWQILLDGDRPAAAGDESGSIMASEPFADANANGTWDAATTADAPGEPYLDVDRNGDFTRELGWIDAAGDGRRSTGIRECYRLADWRRVRCMHAPRIVSGATAEVTENAPLEEVVYTARAEDVDGDAIVFAIEPDGDGDAEESRPAPGVVIEPKTGVVRLLEPADFERRKSHEFVVVATDATGLIVRQPVRLRVRDMPLESSATP